MKAIMYVLKRHFFKSFSFYLLLGSICYLIIGAGEAKVNSQEQPTPTVNSSSLKYQLKSPDWSKISWSKLPALRDSGSITLPMDIVKKLGYDPSRVWNVGQKPESVVMLGDVEDFKISNLSLKKISAITSLNQNLSLKDFGLVQWQTPESLLKAIPSLAQLNITQVKPLADLLSLSGGAGSGTISGIIQSNPLFGKMPLKSLDLSKYQLSSIPGIESTPIGEFQNWQGSFIDQVPGLKDVPFSQMPAPLGVGSLQVGVASVVFSKAEHGDSKVDAAQFISGSVNSKDATVAIACNTGAECPYLELSDLSGSSGSLYGKRWASGVQKVKGGFGILGSVNGGKEPAGKLVYGSAFKVVLTSIDEAKGTANFGLYFRACAHVPFGGRTCTPYFIGPVPWIPVHENDLVIVGIGS
jgi:hypothetical protein